MSEFYNCRLYRSAICIEGKQDYAALYRGFVFLHVYLERQNDRY